MELKLERLDLRLEKKGEKKDQWHQVIFVSVPVKTLKHCQVHFMQAPCNRYENPTKKIATTLLVSKRPQWKSPTAKCIWLDNMHVDKTSPNCDLYTHIQVQIMICTDKSKSWSTGTNIDKSKSWSVHTQSSPNHEQYRSIVGHSDDRKTGNVWHDLTFQRCEGHVWSWWSCAWVCRSGCTQPWQPVAQNKSNYWETEQKLMSGQPRVACTETKPYLSDIAEWNATTDTWNSTWWSTVSGKITVNKWLVWAEASAAGSHLFVQTSVYSQISWHMPMNKKLPRTSLPVL